MIDWYSRCIVGWEVDDTLDTRMVINALKKAFKVTKPQILNSDQGCQFTSHLTQYNNIREARISIGKYIHTYNFERRHSALEYQTPAECYYPALLLPYVA